MEEGQWMRAIRRGDKKYFADIAEKYYDDIFRFCAFFTGSREDAYDLVQETFLRFIQYAQGYRERNLKGYLLTIAANVCRSHMGKKGKEKGRLVSLDTYQETDKTPGVWELSGTGGDGWQGSRRCGSQKQGSGGNAGNHGTGVLGQGYGGGEQSRHSGDSIRLHEAGVPERCYGGSTQGEDYRTGMRELCCEEEKYRSGIEKNIQAQYIENGRQDWFLPEQYAVECDIHERLMEALAQLPDMQREAILLYYLQDMKYREISHMTGVSVSTAKSRVRQGMEKLQERLKKEDFLG